MEAAPEAGSPPAAAGAEVPAAWAAATDDGPAAAAEGAQADVLVVKRGGPSEADGLPAPEWEDEQGGGDGGDGGDGEGGGAADAAADALAALQLKSGAAATEAGSPGGSPGIKAHRGRVRGWGGGGLGACRLGFLLCWRRKQDHAPLCTPSPRAGLAAGGAAVLHLRHQWRQQQAPHLHRAAQVPVEPGGAGGA